MGECVYFGILCEYVPCDLCNQKIGDNLCIAVDRKPELG